MEKMSTYIHMETKKVATNIPVELLKEATDLTGLNQTQALIAGLKELIAERKREKLLGLRERRRRGFAQLASHLPGMRQVVEQARLAAQTRRPAPPSALRRRPA